MNGFALGLGFKRRLRATRKWAIEITVYENAKVLNIFLLINWLTIYFNFQGIVYLFLMRMKYYKMCFSNIER